MAGAAGTALSQGTCAREPMVVHVVMGRGPRKGSAAPRSARAAPNLPATSVTCSSRASRPPGRARPRGLLHQEQKAAVSPLHLLKQKLTQEVPWSAAVA